MIAHSTNLIIQFLDQSSWLSLTDLSSPAKQVHAMSEETTNRKLNLHECKQVLHLFFVFLCFFYQRDLGILSDLCKSILLHKDTVFKNSLEKILSKNKVPLVRNYVIPIIIHSSLSLMWLTESVQWIFLNQRLGRHVRAGYTIIMSRTFKVTGDHFI